MLYAVQYRASSAYELCGKFREELVELLPRLRVLFLKDEGVSFLVQRVAGIGLVVFARPGQRPGERRRSPCSGAGPETILRPGSLALAPAPGNRDHECERRCKNVCVCCHRAAPFIACCCKSRFGHPDLEQEIIVPDPGADDLHLRPVMLLVAVGKGDQYFLQVADEPGRPGVQPLPLQPPCFMDQCARLAPLNAQVEGGVAVRPEVGDPDKEHAGLLQVIVSSAPAALDLERGCRPPPSAPGCRSAGPGEQENAGERDSGKRPAPRKKVDTIEVNEGDRRGPRLRGAVRIPGLFPDADPFLHARRE